MFSKRVTLGILDCSRFSWNFVTGSREDLSFALCRLFRCANRIGYEVNKRSPIAPLSVRHIAQQHDPLSKLGRQKYVVKQTLLRGKASTELQTALLNDFVKDQDEVAPEQWKQFINKIFELEHGLIHEKNIDSKVLESCVIHEKLSLARSYLHYIKFFGRKYNTAIACSYIRVCYECKESMTTDDVQKVQLFTKFLVTKYPVVDSIVGDAVVKGLILCDMGEKAFQILENLNSTACTPSSVNFSLALYSIQKNECNKAFDLIRCVTDKSVWDSKFFVKCIEHFKNDRHKLDTLLMLFRETDFKPNMKTCDRLVTAYENLPCDFRLKGTYGTVNNSGNCSVCQQRLERLDLSEEEFAVMRKSFFNLVLVGQDLFQNTTPAELRQFIKFVEKNAPFDIVLDGLNVAYMSGVSVSPEVYVSLVKRCIIHFMEQNCRILLIGRKHMSKWKNLVSILEEFGVKYFFIADISEDDVFLIYSALYSGLNSNFVTRDLLRSEKFGLSEEKERSLFKRWQQSHQIFISYVAPSGRVYAKTPITFQMTTQKTSRGGWHVPYTLEEDFPKDEYGIHRSWLCLDRDVR